MTTVEHSYDLGLSSDSEPGSPVGKSASDYDSDLRSYAKSLGLELEVDPDMAWVAKEAFDASLPPSWSEHTDGEGRIYFFNQVSQESSWSHPMDAVFRELVEQIKTLRRLDLPESSLEESVQGHLQDAYARASAALDGWSGPHVSETGEFYYHEAHKVSTWDNPVHECYEELMLRQHVLERCLLPDRQARPSPGQLVDGELNPLPALPLNLARSNLEGAVAPPSPSSARSFVSCISARSTCSARSATPSRARRSTSPRSHKAVSPVSPRVVLAEAAAAAEAAKSSGAGSGSAASTDGGCSSDAAKTAESSKSRPAGAQEDELEITFGVTAGLALPQFGH